MDLVSVTISAYNHERYIEECIRSIIAQTYENIELLVIDDGSTDRTFEILQSLKPECEKRFVRVVFETQKNQGTKITGNKLIDMARGKYIFTIASDDVAKPHAIETLCTFLMKNTGLCSGCRRQRNHRCGFKTCLLGKKQRNRTRKSGRL